VKSSPRVAIATLVTASLAFAGLVAMPAAAVAAPLTTTVAAAPAPDASLSGKVTSTKSKKAIAGATIEVYGYDEDEGDFIDEPIATATTGAKGTYTLDLRHGAYAVKFVAPVGSSTYVDEFWKNAPSIWESDYLELEAGDALKNIDGSLAPSSRITGTILSPGGTAFAPADIVIDVCTVEKFDDGWDVWVESECGYGRATIDAAGKYTVSNLSAGKYTVYASYVGTGNFRNEYYPNARSISDAKTFAVKSGATVSAKNLVLEPGATITGTVNGDAPLAGAIVEAYPVDADYGDDSESYEDTLHKTATTNAQGVYTLTGLWADSYKLNTRSTTVGGVTYAGEWFDDANTPERATPVAASDTAPTVRDIQLSRAAALSGTVTDAANAPVADISVVAYRALSTRDNRDEYITETTTDANGQYAFTELPAGDYFIYLSTYSDEWGPSPYLDSYYGAEPGESVHEADRVTLGEGIDGELALRVVRGGSYSGTILADGEPLYDASVSVVDDDGEYSAETTTDENGEFTLVGLSAGGHTVEVDYYDWGYEGDWELSDSGNETQYQTLSIVAPPVATDSATVELGELSLEASSSLTGKVTGATGKPIKYASLIAFTKVGDEVVQVEETETDSKGRYAFSDLPTGDVYVVVQAAGYSVQFLGGTDDLTLSTPVRVPAAGSALSRDIQLFKGTSVSGTVRDAVTGRLLPEVLVYAAKHSLDAAVGARITDYAITSKKGTYSIPGLSAGSYSVSANEFDPYNDVSTRESQVKQTYVAHSPVKMNFTLAPRVKISGIVTNAAGAPLEDISVVADDRDFETFSDSTAITDENGYYQLWVDAGEYVLQFASYDTSYAETFAGNTADIDDATIIDANTAPIVENVTMLTFPGRVTGRLVGEFASGLSGWFYVERTPLGGGATRGQAFYYEDGDLPDTVDIANLQTGDYTIEIGGYDDAGNLDGYSGSFTITADEPTAALGDVDLGENLGMADDESPGNTGVLPTIANSTPTVGDELQVDVGEWDDEIVDFEFQWFRGDKPILGATGERYFVTPGDAGKKLAVRVVPIDEYGPVYWTYLTTAPTAVVATAPAANANVEPTITGATRVGQTLTLNSGEWDLPGLNFAYSWVRTTGETTKVVSTKATYKPVVADIVGSSLSATVTVTRAGFESTSRTLEVGVIQPSTALTQTAKSVVTFDEATDTYSVTPGTWSPKGATVSYLWFIGDDEGEGAVGEGNSFEGSEAYPSFALSVKVTATKPGYASTTVEYLVRPVQVLEWTSQPTTRGVNEVGGVLSIKTDKASTLPDATGYSFEWRVDGKTVKGATTSTYSPTKAGGLVTAVITATRAKYGSATTELTEFGTTTTGGSFEGDFSISGTQAVGHVLTANLDDVSPLATTATFQWFRSVNGGAPVKIAKATKSTYAPTIVDYQTELSVVATLSRSGYTKTVLTATSYPIDARTPHGEPKIATTAQVGSPITAARGDWDTVGTSFTYQWTINGTPIVGATTATYTPRAEDIDEELAVVVTGTIAGIAPGSETSNSVTVEPGVAPKPTKVPAITVGGKSVTTTALGRNLVASAGTWKSTGIALSYQWQLNNAGAWVDIDGATSSALLLDSQNDGVFAKGWKYRVVVIATKAGHSDSAPVVSKTVTIK